MTARLPDTPHDNLQLVFARLAASRSAAEAESTAEQLRESLQTELATPSPAAAQRFEAAWQALSALPEEWAGEALGECLLSFGYHCYLANRCRDGLAPAARAISFARELGNKQLLRKALTVKGFLHADSGGRPAAIEAYAEALRVARELADTSLEAPVWNNIGVVLVASAQYADALRCYERAAALAHGAHKNVQGSALANAAICALQLRDFRTGLKRNRQAIDFFANPVTALECVGRTTLEAIYARLFIAVGDIKQASEHAQAASHFAQKLPSARSDYAALQIRGLLDVHAGRLESGLALLTQALELARQQIPAEIADSLSMCIEGYETAGQPDVALVYLHELSALNRETGAAQELVRQLQEDREIEAVRYEQPIEARLAGDAARLQTAVDLQQQRLINAAIDAALSCGYDLYRVFRVSKLACLFAAQQGRSVEQVQSVALAGKLIDIGMIATPEPLLSKTRALSEGERKVVDDHTRFGAELLTQASLAMLQPCIPAVRFHHERWDGSGPWSLKGDAIPLEARLLALADAFDAMTHPRPWRPEALRPAMALREISAQAGRQFDPDLAEGFVDFVQREFRKHDDFLVFLGEEGQSNEYVKARERIVTMMRTDARP